MRQRPRFLRFRRGAAPSMRKQRTDVRFKSFKSYNDVRALQTGQDKTELSNNIFDEEVSPSRQ